MTTRLKLSIGRTYNLGNFQSLRLDVGMEDDISSFDTEEDAFRKMENILTTQLSILEKEAGIKGGK
uniref:Uncharacterized protein n=1 Tax=viral metagenome TaxID=1070528 RepID=A0A6M3J909_9ZZZZ